MKYNAADFIPATVNWFNASCGLQLHSFLSAEQELLAPLARQTQQS